MALTLLLFSVDLLYCDLARNARLETEDLTLKLEVHKTFDNFHVLDRRLDAAPNLQYNTFTFNHGTKNNVETRM